MDVARRRPAPRGLPWRRAALVTGAVLAGGWGLAGTLRGGDGSAGPRFSADGSLVRPEGVERWVLVGASLGMGYAPSSGSAGDGADAGSAPDAERPDGHFHNVQMDPVAFDHYAETGEFPEGAMLAIAVHE